MNKPNKTTGSYAESGVNIDRGNALVERIGPLAKSTFTAGVMGNLGGFGALFDISSLDYKQPILVSGTDGVGTKLRLAIDNHIYTGVGIDLVAMCVNDLLVMGAEPLFFLDYYACNNLNVDVAAEVIESIAKGCELAGCALTGGETAEMPGMYGHNDFDLAGFCVGVVEKDDIISGKNITEGDHIIALASSGPHSNGYSLIRKVLDDSNTKLSDTFSSQTFSDVLMAPTRIYVKSVHKALKHSEIKGISHITGGGLLENIPRILPDGTSAEIDTSSWEWPRIFNWIKQTGNIDTREMYRTFNCGIGMVLITDPEKSDELIATLIQSGEQAWHAGQIRQSEIKETIIS